MKHFKSIGKGVKMLLEAQTAQELFQTLTPPNSTIFQVCCTESLRLRKTEIRLCFVQFWTKNISKPCTGVHFYCCTQAHLMLLFFPADAISSQSKVVTMCTKPCRGWGGENKNLSKALAVSASHCHHSCTITSLFYPALGNNRQVHGLAQFILRIQDPSQKIHFSLS